MFIVLLFDLYKYWILITTYRFVCSLKWTETKWAALIILLSGIIWKNLSLLYVLLTHMWIYQKWLVQKDRIYFSLCVEDRSNNIYCDPNVPGTLNWKGYNTWTFLKSLVAQKKKAKTLRHLGVYHDLIWPIFLFVAQHNIDS